jgi:UDP-N-acetyl-D-glucosamine dehydrogenase
VGLGYVGLPLALEFFRAGFQVRGLDIDQRKVDALNGGKSYILHIAEERVAAMATSGRFRASADFRMALECDALLLCVPTPLTRHREPDMTYVEGTARSLAPHLRLGQLICLESTTYPGTTREVMIPALEAGSNLRAGEDFFVAYSPEREDPSNKQYSTATIPKVVGGHTEEALAVAKALYDAIVVETVPVSSCDVAEAAKLVENIFRSVNIAMVNELKMVFHRMGIDIWEVIDAAKTKPFGYMPFYPGPGLGGHCIPIDPFYLTWKAREYDLPTRFIELAGEINTQMPYYVVSRAMEVLNDSGVALRGSKLLLVGLAYKPDVDDERESPTFKLMELLEVRGARVDYHDPHIPVIKQTREHAQYAGRVSVSLDRAGEYDAVIISTAHAKVDYQMLARTAKVIIDTRNIFSKLGLEGMGIHKA